MKKRICLFAAYNADGYVREYVYDYLEELSKYADIYYLADNVMSENDPCTDRLLKHCKNVYFSNHGKYDFGSYSELAQNFVGWKIILKYDELIFANDSCFCVQPFDTVFKTMDKKSIDMWGLTATDERNYEYFYTLEEYMKIPSSKVPNFCIGSYFMVFKKNVFKDLDFQDFINSVKKEANRLDVCFKYEIGLTHFLKKKKYKISTFIDVIYRNVTIYDQQGIRLLKRGFPLVKIKTFTQNPLSIQSLDNLKKSIATYTKNNKIYEYLKQVIVKPDLPQIQAKENLWVPPIFKNTIKDILKLFLPPIAIHTYKKIKHRNQTKNQDIGTPSNQCDCNSTEPNGDFIIYFNVAVDTIGGGMLSIDRFIRKTIEKFENSDKIVLMSGLPFSNQAVRYTMFESKLEMHHFDDIVKMHCPERLILHIPEYYLPIFIESLSDIYKNWLYAIPYLHINIMDQNHDYFPDRGYLEHCKEYTDKVTITTAHEQYTTMKIANQVDCPIKLLTPFLPDFYRKKHSEKEKIIAISEDNFVFDGVSKKDEAIAHLKTKLPEYQIIIIKNLSLEEYKQLISKALFTITFGEGYDGYYIEPFLSDSVAFAVYNETFFPPIFKNAPTVYSSYNVFMKNIIKDIKKLEKNPLLYDKYCKISEKLIREITNDENSIKNLQDFYDDKYDLIPEVCARTGFYKQIT